MRGGRPVSRHEGRRQQDCRTRSLYVPGFGGVTSVGTGSRDSGWAGGQRVLCVVFVSAHWEFLCE